MPQGLAGSRPPAPTILKPTFSGASVWAAYSAIWIHSPNRDGSKAALKTTRSARDDTKARTRPVAPSLEWDPQSRHSRPGACQGLTFNAAGMIVIEADFRGVFRMGPYRRLGSCDRGQATPRGVGSKRWASMAVGSLLGAILHRGCADNRRRDPYRVGVGGQNSRVL
jgi:hypothetical protein